MIFGLASEQRSLAEAAPPQDQSLDDLDADDDDDGRAGSATG